MSLILGTIVREEINIGNAYLTQILREIKHYLTLQTSIIVNENEHCLKISSVRKVQSNQPNHINEFFILKNFMYLFPHWQRIHIENEEDLEFFDVCYQCLMIVKEYLPSKISIGVEIISELMNELGLGTSTDPLSLVEFVENFESQKNEEFSRRVNSNFKSLASMHESQISQFEIENILYLSQYFYYYKNKLAAFKFLAQHQHIKHQQLLKVDEKYSQFLMGVSVDEDFRNYSTQILQKIELAKQILHNQQNKALSESNLKQSSSQEHSKLQDNSSHQNKFIKSKPDKIDKISQKQLRSSNNQNSNFFEMINRQPLKQFNRTIQKESKAKIQITRMLNGDKLRSISGKSVLFQLRQSESLRRLSMLIKAASQSEFKEMKIEEKIRKEIEKVCRNFLNGAYQSVQKKQQSDYEDSKNLYFHNQEKAEQLGGFYESLEEYFAKKGALTKSTNSNKPNTKKDSSKDGQTNQKKLLNQVYRKISNLNQSP